jgi:hypothetical protein
VVPGGSGGTAIGKPYLHMFILKTIFIFRNIKPISIKLHTNHPWVKRIKIVEIKGKVLIKSE